MSQEARIRINTHRLMRSSVEDAPVHVVRIEHNSATRAGHTALRERAVLYRALLHVGLFAVSFVFTAGVLVLAVLLWVRPDSFALLVFVGVFSSLVFVAVFSLLRMLIFHAIMPDEPQGDVERGLTHHLSKSIAYGFVALAVALALMGLIVNLASGFATP